MSGIQVSEEFLRHAAMLMRQRDVFDGEAREESNKVWGEIMQEVRGRIVMGLDQLDVRDYPEGLTIDHKPIVDYILEWIRGMLRRGEI